MNEAENTRTVPEWLRKITLEWQIPNAQLAKLLGLDEIRLAEVLTTRDSREGGTIPSGFDAAPALIRIYQLLTARHPKTEDQVKWLFSGHPDFGDTKPIDVAASSRENLFWVAYYLESSVAKEKTPGRD